jgi:hypothetical protein
MMSSVKTYFMGRSATDENYAVIAIHADGKKLLFTRLLLEKFIVVDA